jgi:hypothetical protein
MAVDTAEFQKAHDQPRAHGAGLRAVAERLPELTPAQREKELRRLLRYLRDRIDQGTKVDELLLYPQVPERLGDPLIAVSMNYDQLAIRHWIRKIAAADVTDTDRLRQLLYGLDALISVRTWKENELSLALLEASARPGSGC